MDDESLPLSRSGLKPRTDPQMLLSQGGSVLFPGARDAQAALAGLLLKQGCWNESHEVAQDLDTMDGSYWHAILHRIEPDLSNSAYWFRRVGNHPIFPALVEEARNILLQSGPKHWMFKEGWDPYRFNSWCDEARQTGGQAEITAVAIQSAECRLLLEWCSHPSEALMQRGDTVSI